MTATYKIGLHINHVESQKIVKKFFQYYFVGLKF